MPARPFLSARWVDLLLVTWQVPDELLAPRLPAGVELDRYEGHALVSLVAFDFLDVRVGGMAWPGWTAFPELNLRFYIRAGGKRGVCFIREYVPTRVVAGIARLLYNEPYRRVPYRKDGAAHVLQAGGRTHRIAWETEGDLYTPAASSLEHFLKEHDLGVGQQRDGRTLAYRVDHPVWRVWPRVRPALDVDFATLYGAEWEWLRDAAPLSVVAAEGSAVCVYPPTVL
jgi:uncharacterized protein